MTRSRFVFSDEVRPGDLILREDVVCLVLSTRSAAYKGFAVVTLLEVHDGAPEVLTRWDNVYQKIVRNEGIRGRSGR